MGKSEGDSDRRSMGDRRTQRRPRLRFLLFGGRRKSARRLSDKQVFIYVDQYHPWLLVAIMLLAILSILDGIFTLHLIKHGAIERNPIMAWFLGLGTMHFITAKVLLTSTPLLILLVFHNRYSRLLHIHVKALIPAFVVAFLLVLLWQLLLDSWIN